MKLQRARQSRRDAERLLDHPAAHGSALGTLLAAAAAPAQPDELRHEDATAAAFRRTAMVPSSGPTVPGPRRSGRAAARAVVATSAVVALASGGFALAGSADLPHIPGLPGQASDRATESVAQGPKSSEASSSSTTPEGQVSATGGPKASASGKPGSSSPTSPTSTPSSTPAPQLRGLCRAFQATDHSAHGSSLDSAAFAALAEAASSAGAAGVASYCVELIGEPRETGKPSVLPTPTSKPTGKPTGKPSPSKPTGKPSSATGRPSDKPTPPGKGGGKNH